MRIESEYVSNVYSDTRRRKRYSQRHRETDGIHRKGRKKKYRTYKNVKKFQDDVNRQFTIELYSVGF